MKFKGPNGEILELQAGYYVGFIDDKGCYYSYPPEQITLIEKESKSETVSNMDIVKNYIDDLRHLQGLKKDNPQE